MALVGELLLSWGRDQHFSNPWHSAITTFSFGVAVHQIIRQFEIDSLQVETLQIFVAVNGLVAFVSWQTSTGDTLREDVLLVLWMNLCFFVGLFFSIALYRTYFHRLHNFPGPFCAKVTKFWAFRQAAKTVQWNETVRGLHRQFGDFVRIGLFVVHYREQILS